MSNEANVARGAHQRYFTGTQATAEMKVRDVTSGKGGGTDILRYSADELEDRYPGEGNVAWGNAFATFYDLTIPTHLDADHAALTVFVAPHWGRTGVTRAARGNLLSHEGVLGIPQETQPPTADPQQYANTLRRVYSLSDFTRATLLPLHIRELEAALADLDGLGEEAREEDLPEPDAEAVANARTLLPELFSIYPVRYRVSPTERRGVAIDAPMKWGASVAVECAPDDTVYCFVTINGNSRRAKFYQMEGLPDAFIAKALRDLELAAG